MNLQKKNDSKRERIVKCKNEYVNNQSLKEARMCCKKIIKINKNLFFLSFNM